MMNHLSCTQQYYLARVWRGVCVCIIECRAQMLALSAVQRTALVDAVCKLSAGLLQVELVPLQHQA
jgi:hypothetical protein